ncbi:MAG: hypothetical protein GY857_17605, partial [Desulfobacula sp.]|nr:hypothetical protein [Desulfobacula sp.]
IADGKLSYDKATAAFKNHVASQQKIAKWNEKLKKANTDLAKAPVKYRAELAKLASAQLKNAKHTGLYENRLKSIQSAYTADQRLTGTLAQQKQTLAQRFDNLGQATINASKKLDGSKEAYAGVRAELSSLEKTQKGHVKSIEKQIDAVRKNNNAITEAKAKYPELSKEIKKFSQEVHKGSMPLSAFRSELGRLERVRLSDAKAQAKQMKTYNDAQATVKLAQAQYPKLRKQIEAMRPSLESGALSQTNFGKRLKAASVELRNQEKAAKGATPQLNKFGAAISSVGNSLKSLASYTAAGTVLYSTIASLRAGVTEII